MIKRIAVIQGHPDPAKGHLCHALADAYADGAAQAGFEVKRLDVASLDFPVLRSPEDWTQNPVPEGLVEAKDALIQSDHLVLVYPLWLGTMPALLKAFLEQVFRPAMLGQGDAPSFDQWSTLMKGTSARVVVTMGMPASFYRFFYFAHSLKSLERNILKFVGIGPIRESLFDVVEAVSDDKRKQWTEQMRKLGSKGV